MESKKLFLLGKEKKIEKVVLFFFIYDVKNLLKWIFIILKFHIS